MFEKLKRRRFYRNFRNYHLAKANDIENSFEDWLIKLHKFERDNGLGHNTLVSTDEIITASDRIRKGTSICRRAAILVRNKDTEYWENIAVVCLKEAGDTLASFISKINTRINKYKKIKECLNDFGTELVGKSNTTGILIIGFLR